LANVMASAAMKSLMAGRGRGLGAAPGKAGANRVSLAQGAFSQPGLLGGTTPDVSAIPSGALYGALDALQAGAQVLANPMDDNAGDDIGPNRGGLGDGTWSPEQVWRNLPSGGEEAWSNQNRRPMRLKVARLQQALSEAATGLAKATDACKDINGTMGGLFGDASPGVTARLRRECTALEAESRELLEERTYLDCRAFEIKQELRQLKEQLYRPPTGGASPRSNRFGRDLSAPSSPGSQPSPRPKSGNEDVSELAVVLRLLACLKDVALQHRALVLPQDPAQWTREHQVVAYFLDEVEACKRVSEKMS